jgi:hypothetical protein
VWELESGQSVCAHLGVSVMSLLGQLLSQKPHSMQRSTSSLASGLGLRNFLCASGSLQQAHAQHSTGDQVRHPSCYMPAAWIGSTPCNQRCMLADVQQTIAQCSTSAWHTCRDPR